MKFAKVRITAVCFVVATSLMAGCGRLPGKPSERDRWSSPAAVTDFNQLYSQNCAGCHGANGSLGAATPLNDPLYLALVGPVAMRNVIATGVPGTAMPAFAAQSGGMLTDKQLDSLVAGMSSAWGRPDEFNEANLPPYSLQDAAANGSAFGDASRGAAVYQTYCAQCHGVNGNGGPKGGSIVDPHFLALVSDQHLRTTVIAGRPDLGKPNWSANVSGKPLSPQEISDVVAWLSAKRTNTLALRSGYWSNFESETPQALANSLPGFETLGGSTCRETNAENVGERTTSPTLSVLRPRG